MADDDAPPDAKSGSGNLPADAVMRRIELSIDAVDWLRQQMRTLGMPACADALDEAFVQCLSAYLDLRGREPPEPNEKPGN